MARRYWIASLTAVLALAGIAGVGYAGYGYQQRKAALEGLSPILRTITVRLDESFAIESSATMTYKELFERMDRYVAVADDKILELRAMDASRTPGEHAFVSAYAGAAQNVWRAKRSMYQASLRVTSSQKWADERMDELARNYGSRAYILPSAYKAVADAQEAVDQLDLAQREYLATLHRLSDLSGKRPSSISESDLAKPAAIDLSVKTIDRSLPEGMTKILAGYRRDISNSTRR